MTIFYRSDIMIFVVCPTIDRAHKLMKDYLHQYPQEVIHMEYGFLSMVITDGISKDTVNFMSEYNLSLKTVCLPKDALIIFEDGFREMYQVR